MLTFARCCWQTVIELRKNVQEWLPKLQTGDVILTAHMMRRGRDPMLEIALNLAQHVTAHVTDVVSSAGIVMSHAITVVVVGGDGEGRHDLDARGTHGDGKRRAFCVTRTICTDADQLACGATVDVVNTQRRANGKQVPMRKGLNILPFGAALEEYSGKCFLLRRRKPLTPAQREAVRGPSVCCCDDHALLIPRLLWCWVRAVWQMLAFVAWRWNENREFDTKQMVSAGFDRWDPLKIVPTMDEDWRQFFCSEFVSAAEKVRASTGTSMSWRHAADPRCPRCDRWWARGRLVTRQRWTPTA